MFAQSMFLYMFFYVGSIVMTLSCSDWFLVWVGLEINMMSFIVLIYDRSSQGAEISLKYFFIQSVGSGILMILFYTEFFGFEYVTLGVLSYKMGGGPFFFWFPSMCENMGWGCCFLLMTVQKILPLLIISFLVSMFLWVMIISSIIIGGVGSLNQNSMKRLMGFSSIHHVGWVMSGNFMGEYMWYIYLLIYSLLVGGVMWPLWKSNTFELGQVSKVMNKWSFVLGMLSMGGMPPMLGFYLKWWLFFNLLKMDYSILLLMVFISVLMFYVYLRIVYNTLMGDSAKSSWGGNSSGVKLMSMDFMFLLGINVGSMAWMILMSDIKMMFC